MTPDPFKELLEKNALQFNLKLAENTPKGFKVGVAVRGAALGPLPGSPRLYVLVADAYRELETLEVVDLEALGLGEVASFGAGAVEKFQNGLLELGQKIQGTSILVAEKFAGILPSRLVAKDVKNLLEGDFGLDYLTTAINMALNLNKNEEEPKKIEPLATGPGQYFLDLKAALAKEPDLSSKKILRPFLQTVNFKELTIKCDHAPPWLPLETAKMGYDLMIEKGEDEVTLFLKKV
ncbi:MAG: hypothetical protein LBI10_03195 [Deltaproteobacteria bacterium]|jgi:hypothetical protein|nr:hypothetical protein [Deltaproteobacteria bacterium]